MQLSILDEKPTYIPGLIYIPDYITKLQEEKLINFIDKESWNTELKRRVQHYGYKYNYKTGDVDIGNKLGDLPHWLYDICNKLLEDKILTNMPDQVIINEYFPGQGIASHIDSTKYFDDNICSLSLISPCVMDFTGVTSSSILLEPKSLLVLKGDARYFWKHSIAPRMYDSYGNIKIKRERRLSLTFRKLLTL
ncbi:MAG UNVERIFIED_CONTAM: alpha-ketoglutarate-dependent dioxygenase AlkB [Rickettsiaceae bacterium]|jgi:alkylated DNA repair dioxygenase AlkB